MDQRTIRLTVIFVGCAIMACTTPATSAQVEPTDELLQAVSARDASKVNAILSERPELARASIDGVSILLPAVFAKAPGAAFLRPEDNELVAAFLARKPELGLHEAAVLGRLNRLRELVQEDPSRVHEPAPSDWTPLHFAAFSGNVECVRLLLEMGADIHRRAGDAEATGADLIDAILSALNEVVKRCRGPEEIWMAMNLRRAIVLIGGLDEKAAQEILDQEGA